MTWIFYFHRLDLDKNKHVVKVDLWSYFLHRSIRENLLFSYLLFYYVPLLADIMIRHTAAQPSRGMDILTLMTNRMIQIHKNTG